MNIKQILADSGVTVHRDMNGPVDSIGGRVVLAMTKKLNEAVLEHLKTLKHFTLYKIHGDRVRYGAW